jgi:hypothetical protein
MASGETVPLRRGEFALSGDAKGNIYIGAQDKGVYWRVTPAGFEQIVSCNAAVPGMFTVDEHHNVYVSNQGLRPAIRKISPEGEVAILAGGVRDPQEPRNVHNYADSVNGWEKQHSSHILVGLRLTQKAMCIWRIAETTQSARLHRTAR